MDQKIKCSQCGMELPASEVISYEGHHVCALCKPTFVQKLREGVTISSDARYAGFWIRVGAKLIDGIGLALVGWVVSLIIYMIFPRPQGDPASPEVVFSIGYFVNLFFSLAIGVSYVTWMTGKYGATLGKMACGIKVIMSDGGDIRYGRAFGRYFAEILSSLIFCIGYIMVAGDKEKRALHDRICNTRVIYKS